ncbi:MAG TPA: alpha/beta hydrolase-fold protein [Gemmatimonadaceae bacterium]|nr:alpha/beta hydrolase-fold protein [Gemmatimonadaceae bacterium]
MIGALALLLQAAALGAGGTPPATARGTVVTDTLWSQALGTRKLVIVYLPPSYGRDATRRYPVAYYLHGITGRETDWTRQGQLDVVMDSLAAAGAQEMIVVMPDGDDGWYTTWNALPSYDDCRRKPPERESAESYCVPWPHYDDYVARDVVQFVDRKYRTEAVRAHRAIGGLSMGGYGAVTLAFVYPDIFSAAASHSGVLAPLYMGPHPFAGVPVWAESGEALERGWGRLWPLLMPVFGRDTATWWARDPGRRLDRFLASKGREALPALFLDVGTEDGLADHSRAFRALAERRGVAITYHEWPGAHDWKYWRAHVGESLSWLGAQIAR